MQQLEEQLRFIIRKHLSVVTRFNPYSRFEGVETREDFLRMIGSDPAFRHFFLDNEQYAIARVGGNMITSLHRKLGDLYEDIFKALLTHHFSPLNLDLDFRLQILVDEELQERSTDGLLRYEGMPNLEKSRILQIRLGLETLMPLRVAHGKN